MTQQLIPIQPGMAQGTAPDQTARWRQHQAPTQHYQPQQPALGVAQAPSYRNVAMQPRAVVVNTGGLQPITAADSVSPHNKILNVGSRPGKWNGTGQFEVFKLELVLRFKAINLPKISGAMLQ